MHHYKDADYITLNTKISVCYTNQYGCLGCTTIIKFSLQFTKSKISYKYFNKEDKKRWLIFYLPWITLLKHLQKKRKQNWMQVFFWHLIFIFMGLWKRYGDKILYLDTWFLRYTHRKNVLLITEITPSISDWEQKCMTLFNIKAHFRQTGRSYKCTHKK